MADASSPLLINEEPLQVLPSLAVAIIKAVKAANLKGVTGLNEALALQQLQYWLKKKNQGVTRDGRKWIYNSYEEWQVNFPFWSKKTVERIFVNLERLKLVDSRNFGGRDRRKFYAINYDGLNTLVDAANVQDSATETPPQNGALHDDKVTLSDAPKWGDGRRQCGEMEDANVAASSPQSDVMLNKVSENTQRLPEEHTHTARSAQPDDGAQGEGESVCVSEFGWQARRDYGRAHPQSIESADAFAWSRTAREGVFDEAIREWLDAGRPTEGSATSLKPSEKQSCPDCNGSNVTFSDPKDPKTSRPCKHPRLAAARAAPS